MTAYFFERDLGLFYMVANEIDDENILINGNIKVMIFSIKLDKNHNINENTKRRKI